MRYTWIAIFLVSVLRLSAQPAGKVDSLRAIVAIGDDAGAYFELYKILNPVSPDSAFRYLERARLYLKNDQHLEIAIRKNFGREFLKRGFYSMAQKESFEALKLALEIQDSLQIAGIYNNLGLVAFHTHLYDKSAECYQNGLRFSKNRAVERTLKNNYALTLYMARDDQYKALGIYQELLRGTRDSIQMAIYHNNVGTVFLKLGSYDSAYKHITKTLSITTAMRDSARTIYNYSLMGQYYFQTGQYPKAKSYFKQALSLDRRFGDDGLWATVEVPQLYQSMVAVYTKEGNEDSLRWMKDFYIVFLSKKLEAQRKNSAGFVFDSQENELERIEQRQRQSRTNLAEYYGIALVIGVVTIIFFVRSGRGRRWKYEPYISVVILILAFEFVLLVLDPFISRITNDEPLYDFLCNTVLAFVIVPVQFVAERVLRKFVLDIRIRKIAEANG